MISLHFRQVRQGGIARHQAWENETHCDRGPQRYQVEAYTSQEVAHDCLISFEVGIKEAFYQVLDSVA